VDSQVIVITGASEGIGAALAQKLGAENHKLVLAARREDKIKQVAGQSGGQALPVVCDVTKKSDIENLREAALAEFGHIDVWVNNAGRGISVKYMDLTEEDFDQIIDINLKSVFYAIQTIVPYFMQQKKGHLINVSSFLGKVPFVSFRSIYSAAKAALNHMTANLRMDLSADYPDIFISSVMPGPVSTAFAKNVIGKPPSMPPRAGLVKAQTADEVADVMVDTIHNPRPEVFTNPVLAELTEKYYRDVAAFEQFLRNRK
jgi:NADP-dependent 3-hydroxy acid dehydrogenase YdfG